MYIAIDFDGTIVEDKYPGIGNLLPHAKEVINVLHSQGHKILIWSCRQGEDEMRAKHFLIRNGIHFDYFNENHHDLKNKYHNDCRKLGADLYIDDKNIFSEGINWLSIYNYFEEGTVR